MQKGVDGKRLRYVVVDEIVGSSVGLSVCDWPAADRKGRLRFKPSPAEVAADMDDLCAFLQQKGIDVKRSSRKPSNKRELRIGDVFAAEVDRLPNEDEMVSPDHWMVGDVYDISADARLVAKLAFYGALTEPWDEDQAERLGIKAESSSG